MGDTDKFRIRDILKYTRSEAVTMTFDEERRLVPAVTAEPEE